MEGLAYFLIFGFINVIYILTLPFSVYKIFKDASVKGALRFNLLIVIFNVAIIGLLFAMVNRQSTGSSEIEESYAIGLIITILVIVASWFINLIIIAVARKYANKRMPIFQTVGVVPTSSVMGGQGYSAPYMPPVYQAPVPQMGYGMSPQGYSVPAPYGQPPIVPPLQQNFYNNVGMPVEQANRPIQSVQGQQNIEQTQDPKENP